MGVFIHCVWRDCAAFLCEGRCVLEQWQAQYTGGNVLTNQYAGHVCFHLLPCLAFLVSSTLEGEDCIFEVLGIMNPAAEQAECNLGLCAVPCSAWEMSEYKWNRSHCNLELVNWICVFAMLLLNVDQIEPEICDWPVLRPLSLLAGLCEWLY
jgi:hypothetical protein